MQQIAANQATADLKVGWEIKTKQSIKTQLT